MLGCRGREAEASNVVRGRRRRRVPCCPRAAVGTRIRYGALVAKLRDLLARWLPAVMLPAVVACGLVLTDGAQGSPGTPATAVVEQRPAASAVPPVEAAATFRSEHHAGRAATAETEICLELAAPCAGPHPAPGNAGRPAPSTVTAAPGVTSDLHRRPTIDHLGTDQAVGLALTCVCVIRT